MRQKPPALVRPAQVHGFTLIEVMVVIVVMGLLLAMVISRGSGKSPTLILRSAAADVAAALRQGRSNAIVTGHAVPFLIDPAGRRFGLRGSVQELAPGVAIAARVQPAGSIVLQPDGSASNAVIILRLRDLHDTVTLNWLTGQAAVAPVVADGST